MEKLKALGLNKGIYFQHLDPHGKKRASGEIKQFEEEEKKIIRHDRVSNNNVVGIAPSEAEVDKVIAYAEKHSHCFFTTITKKFPNINWIWIG